MRILVADDSETMSALVNDILTAEGHEVDVARTGTEAWQKLSAWTYDAILCDVVLPGIDGLRLYRRVVDLRPEVVSRFVLMSGRTEPSVPILVLTAWDVLVSDEDLADAGVDDVLAKPVLVHELSGRLQKLLAAQSSRS